MTSVHDLGQLVDLSQFNLNCCPLSSHRGDLWTKKLQEATKATCQGNIIGNNFWNAASWLHEWATLGQTATCRIGGLANSMQTAPKKWPKIFHILTFAIDWQSHFGRLNCLEMPKTVCYQWQIVAQGQCLILA